MKKLLFLSIIACMLMSSAWGQRNRRSDSLALVKLYQATGGTQWTHREQWLTGPLNTWYGVTLQAKTGRVWKLMLHANNLCGELPNELEGLDSAIRINLTNNNLYGNIPLLNNIPFFKLYTDSLWLFAIKDRLGFDDGILQGNRYQFADTEKDTSILKQSYHESIIPHSAYSDVAKSQPFGTPVQKRLRTGESYSFAFDYKPTKIPVRFYWMLNDSACLDSTDVPRYTIASFDPAKMSGVWSCTIKRFPNIKDDGYNHLISQKMHNCYLAGTTNRAPVLNKTKLASEATDIYNDFYENLPIRICIWGDDDMNPTKLNYTAVHLPANLNVYLTRQNNNLQLLDLDAFSGSYKYEARVTKKNKDWYGIDSLVMKATDEDGASGYKTYYFTAERRIVQNDSIRVEVLSHTTSTTGTWLRLKNHGDVKSCKLRCFGYELSSCDCRKWDKAYVDTLFTPPVDSFFIPNITSCDTCRNSIQWLILLMPQNPLFQLKDTAFSIDFPRPAAHATLPPGSFTCQLYADPNYLNVQTYKTLNNCGTSLDIFIESGGKIVYTENVWFGNLMYYSNIRRGVKYKVYAKDESRRFISDTVYLELPRTPATTPIVVGKLQLSVQGQLQFMKNKWVTNYIPPLTWKWGTSSKFKISEHNDIITIKALDPSFAGTETVKLSITDSTGYRIDTVITLKNTQGNTAPTFDHDTVRMQVAQTWTHINLLANYHDTETPDSFAIIRMLKQTGLQLKDSNYITELYPSANIYATDTLTIEASDENNAKARTTFLFHKDTSGAQTNEAPRVITPGDLYLHLQFNLVRTINSGRSVWYMEEPETFPTNIDLRNYVTDDQGFDNLRFVLHSQAANGDETQNDSIIKKVFDITIKNGFLSIRPKSGLFVGYQEDLKGFSQTNMIFFLYAQDPFGKKTKIDECIAIPVANQKPYRGFESRLILKKSHNDTLSYDFMRYFINNLPKGVAFNNLFCETYELSLDNHDYWFNKGTLSNNDGKIFIGKTYQTVINPMYPSHFVMNITKKEDIYKRDITMFTYDIELNIYPQKRPQLKALPKQQLSPGKLTLLNLWGLSSGEQQGKDLIWTFSSGKQLKVDFDNRTGMLSVIPRQSSWRGVDTLWITASDFDGLCDSIPIAFELRDTSIDIQQSIMLSAGWNLISTNVCPADSSIAMIFKGLSLAEIKDAEFHWLKTNPAQLNSLKTITAGQAYLVKMDISGMLQIKGKPLAATTCSIPSQTGWLLVGCPFQSAIPLTSLFQSKNCSAIKNFDGFWKPNGTMNSIQDFEPGKGYFLRK